MSGTIGRTKFLSRMMGAAATLAMATSAYAQDASQLERPILAENEPGIVVRSDLLPDANPPSGVLDNAVDITGVGQMRTVTNLVNRSGFVCTGTLINPRTVIFAAHCVNGQAANSYGYNTGGTPISFGFKSDNLVARRLWAGINAAGTTILPIDSNTFQTNKDNAIYSVEHVWYDPRSLEPANRGFINSDVAIATLDTRADDIPTWAMLFTPLTSPTHGLVNGYGARGSSGTSGANLGVDSRRRIAENMIDFLGSLDDRDDFLFGPPNTDLPQSLYQLDFDDPAGQAAYNPGAGRFNFDLFDGAALPREGTTAGGDSGGPLIVDQKFNRPVTIAVLSGGSRFFGPQPFSSYGTSSFYQPLFLYWDLIVKNNPYKYVTNVAGSRDWTNTAHWVQTMDPNYVVERNGQLVNALPGTLGRETSTDTTKFGKVCFLNDCLDITRTGPENAGTGAGLVVEGGPGSTGFVPNNVRANPQAGIAPRYYDVTLAAAGQTRVTTAIEIDRLTINDGALEVRSTGSLTVLGDYTQNLGSLTVDGTLRTGEAFVDLGLVTGRGTIDPTFLTVVRGVVAPGRLSSVGTLTVSGDVILASASTLNIDISRTAADKLIVGGSEGNPGDISVGGTLLLTPIGTGPRDGQTREIISASGNVSGTFKAVFGLSGVLTPSVTYNANSVVLNITAGSLGRFLSPTAGKVETSFANALDSLRTGSYNDLSGLYGMIDLMDPQTLGATLRGLNPTIVGEAASFGRQQSDAMVGLVSNRLSKLGAASSRTGTVEIVGSPEALLQLAGGVPLNATAVAQSSFSRNLTPGTRTFGTLPENMSGFLSGGFGLSQASATDGVSSRSNDRQSWNIAAGLEMEAASNLTLGTAFGFSEGTSRLTGSNSAIRSNHAAVYGSYRLGKGAYVAGLASVANSRIGVDRQATDGLNSARLSAQTNALAYTLHAEAGVNLGIAKGLTLTPKAAVRYGGYKIDRIREAGGELALDLSDIRENRLEGRIGASLDGSVKSRTGWTFAPQVQADFVQALAGKGGQLSARFALADSVAFALPFGSQDRSWAEVKAGMRLTNGALSFGAGLESNIGRYDFRDDRAVADVTVRF